MAKKKTGGGYQACDHWQDEIAVGGPDREGSGGQECLGPQEVRVL